MSKPAVYRCPDGHFRRVIFGIGPFIADYPEQVMLTGIKQGWCPRCVSIFFQLIPSIDTILAALHYQPISMARHQHEQMS
jgi:hypothetical protein